MTMRILIISDTHGRTDNFLLLKRKVSRPDLIIHCGDGTGDFDFIGDYMKSKVTGVSGNCDFFTRESKVMNLNIEGKLLHIEHGNKLPVYSEESMLEYARDNGYTAILYGHTHIQKLVHKDGIWIVNPGSISLPRDGAPSYCLLETDDKGNFEFSLMRIY